MDFNSDFAIESSRLLSGYVDVTDCGTAPAQQMIPPNPASEFALLPDDGERTPFDRPEPTSAPDAVQTPLPAPEQEVQEPPQTEAEIREDDPAEEDEDAKRKAHEEAEAKRKAEFDARQTEKKAAMQAQLDKIAAMNSDEVMAASMQRVSADTEKLTRRNMKECVSEHIQTRCLEDPNFARMVMHPGKSMVRCFQYINRKAREYIEQDMKDNDIDPRSARGVYGSDVPDGLCYQWGENYFRDPDAEEDHRDDEKFVPKPYQGGRSSSKSKSRPKANKKKTEKKSAPASNAGQISLMEMTT